MTNQIYIHRSRALTKALSALAIALLTLGLLLATTVFEWVPRDFFLISDRLAIPALMAVPFILVLSLVFLNDFNSVKHSVVLMASDADDQHSDLELTAKEYEHIRTTLGRKFVVFRMKNETNIAVPVYMIDDLGHES